jgi:hypothetical protein
MRNSILIGILVGVAIFSASTILAEAKGPGGGAQRGEITITKRTDMASPKTSSPSQNLYRRLNTGKHIPRATIN